MKSAQEGAKIFGCSLVSVPATARTRGRLAAYYMRDLHMIPELC